ncbi:spermatogenesis-associated 13 isoform X3 [Pelobates cultripes]|uniref:Spermatogenesis-associated 13 isoform X3 n=1 Tax=Pelobates cultripes TaxID=61616 RepID=A0AAD1R766_PELCU|nr:spermatogenesis-associated 13 isoform X3 [Pelobates cultripes]
MTECVNKYPMLPAGHLSLICAVGRQTQWELCLPPPKAPPVSFCLDRFSYGSCELHCVWISPEDLMLLGSFLEDALHSHRVQQLPCAALELMSLAASVSELALPVTRGKQRTAPGSFMQTIDSTVVLNHRSPNPNAPMVETMTSPANVCGNSTIVTSQSRDKSVSRTVSEGNYYNGADGSSEKIEDEEKLNSSKLTHCLAPPKQRASASNERPHSMVSTSNSSTWNALSSLRKMGSFKKLKSSVLQGIQAKENANNLNNQESGGDLKRCSPNDGGGSYQMPCRLVNARPMQECYNVMDGLQSDGSDIEETDNTFLRSTHRSRSIRRAYGAGRINLLDDDKVRSCRSPQALSPARQEQSICKIIVKDSESNRIVYRRSKSTDNLNFLKKSSFKRKSTSNLSDVKSNSEREILQKSMLSTSADSERLGGTPERSSKRWRSPIRAKDFDRVLKIMGNVTDGNRKKEPNKSTSLSADGTHGSRPNSRIT